MLLITLTVQGVDTILTGLNPNKAQGPDEILPTYIELNKSQALIPTPAIKRGSNP